MKEIDWSNLSFGYMKTDYNVRINFRDGAWGELEISSSEILNLHMAATCLHYGQEAFEGLKAFRGKDGKVRIFRLEENAARLQSTCRGILMPELPTERFKEAVLKAVKLNERFIPPYVSLFYAAGWTFFCLSSPKYRILSLLNRLKNRDFSLVVAKKLR